MSWPYCFHAINCSSSLVRSGLKQANVVTVSSVITSLFVNQVHAVVVNQLRVARRQFPERGSTAVAPWMFIGAMLHAA